MPAAFFKLAGILCFLLTACGPKIETPTGSSVPDKGWLFTGKAPYTLQTKVDAAPGPASFQLVTDLSLMADEPETVFSRSVCKGSVFMAFNITVRRRGCKAKGADRAKMPAAAGENRIARYIFSWKFHGSGKDA